MTEQNVPVICVLHATVCTLWGQLQYALQLRSKSMRFGMHPWFSQYICKALKQKTSPLLFLRNWDVQIFGGYIRNWLKPLWVVLFHLVVVLLSVSLWLHSLIFTERIRIFLLDVCREKTNCLTWYLVYRAWYQTSTSTHKHGSSHTHMCRITSSQFGVCKGSKQTNTNKMTDQQSWTVLIFDL